MLPPVKLKKERTHTHQMLWFSCWCCL